MNNITVNKSTEKSVKKCTHEILKLFLRMKKRRRKRYERITIKTFSKWERKNKRMWKQLP